MAKIALVSQDLNAQVQNLAQQLITQRNDVLVITSRDCLIPENLSFQVIQPFQKWSALEALQLFARLLNHLPEVFHFVFANTQQTPSTAHFVLSALLQPFPGRVAASSFFHSPKELSHFRMRVFLRGQHIVTWGSNAHLLNARQKLGISKSILSEVIPALSNEFSAELQHRNELEALTASLGNFLLIPSSPQDFFRSMPDKQLLSQHKMQLAFLCERPKARLHDLDVFYLGALTGADLLFAIKNARGLLLAFSDLSLLELQQFYQLARLTGTPLLVRPRQTEMHPGIVLEGKTGWVLERGASSLQDLLLTNPDLRIQRRQDQQPMLDLVDSTMNELNRLYHKAIALRR